MELENTISFVENEKHHLQKRNMNFSKRLQKDQSKFWDQFFSESNPETELMSAQDQTITPATVAESPTEDAIFVRPLNDTKIHETVTRIIEYEKQKRMKENVELLNNNSIQITQPVRKKQPLPSKNSITFDDNMKNFTRITNVQRKILFSIAQLRKNLEDQHISKDIYDPEILEQIINPTTLATKTEMFLKNFIKNFLEKINNLITQIQDYKPNGYANADLNEQIYALNLKIYESIVFVIRYKKILFRNDPDLKKLKEMISLISKAVTTLIEHEIFDVNDSIINRLLQELQKLNESILKIQRDNFEERKKLQRIMKRQITKNYSSRLSMYCSKNEFKLPTMSRKYPAKPQMPKRMPQGIQLPENKTLQQRFTEKLRKTQIDNKPNTFLTNNKEINRKMEKCDDPDPHKVPEQQKIKKINGTGKRRHVIIERDVLTMMEQQQQTANFNDTLDTLETKSSNETYVIFQKQQSNNIYDECSSAESRFKKNQNGGKGKEMEVEDVEDVKTLIESILGKSNATTEFNINRIYKKIIEKTVAAIERNRTTAKYDPLISEFLHLELNNKTI